MSSLAKMLFPISIQKEALGGRSDGSATHGALAKLLTTMTISANRMATWHQNHSRPMLLTNGAGDASATKGMLKGFFFAGPNMSWPGDRNVYNYICLCGTNISNVDTCKAQVHQTGLQFVNKAIIMLNRPIFAIANRTRAKPTREVVGTWHGRRFTSLHDVSLRLVNYPIHQAIRFSTIAVRVPGQVLSKRHCSS